MSDSSDKMHRESLFQHKPAERTQPPGLLGPPYSCPVPGGRTSHAPAPIFRTADARLAYIEKLVSNAKRRLDAGREALMKKNLQLLHNIGSVTSGDVTSSHTPALPTRHAMCNQPTISQKYVYYKKFSRFHRHPRVICAPVIRIPTSVQAACCSTQCVTVQKNFRVDDDEILRFVPYFGDDDREDVVSGVFKFTRFVTSGRRQRCERIANAVLEQVWGSGMLNGAGKAFSSTVQQLSAVLNCTADEVMSHKPALPRHTMCNQPNNSPKDDLYDGSFRALLCHRCNIYDCQVHGCNEMTQTRVKQMLAKASTYEKDFGAVLGLKPSASKHRTGTRGRSCGRFCCWSAALANSESAPPIAWTVLEQSMAMKAAHALRYSRRTKLLKGRADTCRIALIVGTKTCADISAYLKERDLLVVRAPSGHAKHGRWGKHATSGRRDKCSIKKKSKRRFGKTKRSIFIQIKRARTAYLRTAVARHLTKKGEGGGTDERRILEEYYPCVHEGPCTKQKRRYRGKQGAPSAPSSSAGACSCSRQMHFCGKYCLCGGQQGFCPNIFPGCACKKGRCRPSHSCGTHLHCHSGRRYTRF